MTMNYLFTQEMALHKLALLALVINVRGCSLTNNTCGLTQDLYSKVKQYNRGPNNGAIDDNQDGIVDQFEAFSYWDFEQLTRVFQSGEPQQEYRWANIDTCYVFNVKALDNFEDPSQGILYQTCREFTYQVISPAGKEIGVGAGQACRNFATHRWEIL